MKQGTVGRLYLIIACVFWGSGFTFAKIAVDSIPPSLLLAMRFFVGTAVLGIIFRKRIAALTRSQVLRGGVIGFFLSAACIAQTIGLVDTTPGKNAFLTSVYCILTPFCTWALSKKRPEVKTFVAAAVCLAGIGLISLDGNLSISFGDAMSLLCGVIFAFQIVSIDYLGGDIDGAAMAALEFGFSTVFCLLYHFLAEQPVSLRALSPVTYAVVLYLGLFPTSIAYTLQILGQKKVPNSVSSLIMSLESVFGVAISVLFYGERLTARVGIGFAVIFVAVLIAETGFMDKLLGKSNPPQMLEK